MLSFRIWGLHIGWTTQTEIWAWYSRINELYLQMSRWLLEITCNHCKVYIHPIFSYSLILWAEFQIPNQLAKVGIERVVVRGGWNKGEDWAISHHMGCFFEVDMNYLFQQERDIYLLKLICIGCSLQRIDVIPFTWLNSWIYALRWMYLEITSYVDMVTVSFFFASYEPPLYSVNYVLMIRMYNMEIITSRWKNNNSFVWTFLLSLVWLLSLHIAINLV